MKTPQYLWAIALASLPIATQGFSEEVSAPIGSVSTVNLALTLSKTVDGTVAKDAAGKPIKKGKEGFGTTDYNQWDIAIKNSENVTRTTEDVTKILTTKFSTKELLLDLVDQEIIDDIKGYSIQKIQQTLAGEGGVYADSVKFFLVKKGAAPKSLAGIISLCDNATITGLNQKVIANVTPGTPEIPEIPEIPAIPATEDTPEIPAVPAVPAVPATPDVINSQSVSYSQTVKFAGKLNLSLDEKSISTRGIYTGSEKLAKTKAKEDVILAGAAKMTSLSGTSNAEEIVEGSATFSAGAAADLSAYFPVEEEEEEEGDL